MSSDLAIDFGSVNTRVADERGRILFEQPTSVAINEDSGKAMRFGLEALGYGAQSTGHIRVVRPVNCGQLVDIEVAELFLKYVLETVGRSWLRRRQALVTMPLGTTPVQLRVMSEALERAGIHRVRFLDQPVASALGANIAIEAPLGTMVIDIGGEITNIAAIALGGVIVGTTVRCGGESLDRAVALEILERADLVIDPKVAAVIRRDFGSMASTMSNQPIELEGRDRSSGSVRMIRIHPSEIAELIERELSPVFDATARMITESPPEIANDLMTSGIVLAGGGSLLGGLADRLAGKIAIPVHVFDRPEHLGVLGAARCLSSFRELEESLSSAPRH